jgi:hypothetical protein
MMIPRKSLPFEFNRQKYEAREMTYGFARKFEKMEGDQSDKVVALIMHCIFTPEGEPAVASEDELTIGAFNAFAEQACKVSDIAWQKPAPSGKPSGNASRPRSRRKKS